MHKHDILVLGGGVIGEMITDLLGTTGDFAVTMADASTERLKAARTGVAFTPLQLDVTNLDAVRAALTGRTAVLSALPYNLTAAVAEIAADMGVHYFDLTEDVESTRRVKAAADGANCALVPQCGIAPGFISIAAHDLARHFDTLHDVHMRVGALPLYPANALRYNITWSVEGLVNEYLKPCEAIVDGKMTEVPPLEQLETITIGGETYEAFNTSGGLGTMCETLAGRVRNLNYRSMRYPGHRDILKLLLQDMRLGEDFDLALQVFKKALPVTTQDVNIIYTSVTGEIDGRFEQKTFVRKVYGRTVNGIARNAIQITTASAICAMLDMVLAGQLPQKGFVKQEDAALEDFLANRFGTNFGTGQAPQAIDAAA